MCFSAQASFGASLGLLVIGLLTLRRVKSTRQLLLATIPFMFGAQQAAEGVLWLGIANNYSPLIIEIAKYSFLSFALLIWPIWIPLVMLIIEKDFVRRKILYVCTVIGFLISFYLMLHLIRFGASANIMCSHIVYDSDIAVGMAGLIGFLYFIAVVGSLCVSSVPLMWVLGITIGISYVVSYFFYIQAFTSVWCFFSALLSVIVYRIVKEV